MRRYATLAALIILIITCIVWIASVFLAPEPLPSYVKIVLFFTALGSVTGILANFKDVVELFSRSSNHSVPYKTKQELSSINELINQIQNSLYVDNNKLPHILSLCQVLCVQVGLADKYGLWIRKELEGFFDNASFARQFENEDAFIEWMEKWANHRKVNTYFKFLNQDEASGEPIIVNRKYDEIFLADPLSDIADGFDNARINGKTELSLPFSDLGEQHFQALQRAIRKTIGQDMISREVYLFYSLTELNRMLNQVKSRILEILSESRTKLQTLNNS